MTQANCIFCKIIAQEIPAKVIAHTDDLIVIQDIAPKAPTHFLIIPRKHIHDLSSVQKEDAQLAANMFMMAQQLAKMMGDTSFRFVINNGPGAGQTVFHLHAHFLAGKKMNDL